MYLDFLLQRFVENADRPAIIWRDKVVPYSSLIQAIDSMSETLRSLNVGAGSVVALEGDFSPAGVSLLLALFRAGAIVVPLTASVATRKDEFCETAEVEFAACADAEERWTIAATGRRATHPLLQNLRQQSHPGLILFSSGSTGKAKAAVHDMVGILEKFHVRRASLRAITFLLFDHIGGINTLLYLLSNGGTAVTVEDRSPAAICRAIERHRVQLLPTSPTFINMLLVSEAHVGFDLSSLETVTYGTEVMPESTLRRFRALFPNVNMQQTYGLSELGILRSKSRSPDSLWVRIGGEGFATRVVDGMLEIKARSAMLGYLNAPSPFTPDGWFMTGDAVEVDGEYLRILGRRSEVINVGGEKVYPAEVESVIQMMPGVVDVSVTGEAHAMTGQIVVARVRLATSESLAEFRARMRSHCASLLARYKIPHKVVIVEEDLHTERFKKLRRQ